MVQNRPNAVNVFGAMCLGKSVEFSEGVHDATGGITADMSDIHSEKFTNENTGTVTVPCTTLAEIFRLNRITHIDVFILDVEGSELTVLQTLDWYAVEIDMFVVEMNGQDPKKDAAVRATLRSKGYEMPFKMSDFCHKYQPQCIENELYVHSRFHTNRQQAGQNIAAAGGNGIQV